MKELYTFHDYLADSDIEIPDIDFKHLVILFEIYSEDYIEFCKEEGLAYETLGLPF